MGYYRGLSPAHVLLLLGGHFGRHAYSPAQKTRCCVVVTLKILNITNVKIIRKTRKIFLSLMGDPLS